MVSFRTVYRKLPFLVPIDRILPYPYCKPLTCKKLSKEHSRVASCFNFRNPIVSMAENEEQEQMLLGSCSFIIVVSLQMPMPMVETVRTLQHRCELWYLTF